MTILVFGGTGLIGRAIVNELPGAVALGSEVDVCNHGSVLDALDRCLPSVVVNCAWPSADKHVFGFANVMEYTTGVWQREGVRGCLINLASIYATLPPRFEMYPEGMGKDPAYVAAKAAIVQLTRYYARKVRGSGIRVNCVSPGGVYRDEPQAFVDAYSAQTNHGAMLPARAVAQACKFLVECEWVTGQEIVVADGFDL